MEARMYDVEFLRKDEKTKGSVVKILTEPNKDERFKSLALSEVETMEGETRYFGFNKTTFKACIAVWGNETKDWVGKSMESLGEQKIGAMTGTPWIPTE